MRKCYQLFVLGVSENKSEVAKKKKKKAKNTKTDLGRE